MNSYFITTLGCPKNQADSRQMERSLLRAGYRPVPVAEDADFHLINSCAFVESARAETIETVLSSAGLKRSRPRQKLVLVGCFAERYAGVLEDELPEVDFAFGTGRYQLAGELLSQHFGAPEAVALAGFGEFLRVGQTAAPVKISEGCNRGCAFCAIPTFRGAFQDIASGEILEEVRKLVAAGVREIDLVSQDTNRYGGKVENLLALLSELHQVPELTWIRLLYLYPDARTLQIWRGIVERGLDRVVPYLESPVQHASDRVLRAMRRSGSYAQFVDLFGSVRSLRPELEVRTSLLLGFPGEEDSDVATVIDFVREVRPEKLALFAYSQEEDTPGFARGDPIPREEKAARLNAVREAHLEVLHELHLERVGRQFQAMIESSEGAPIVRRAQDAPEVDELVYLDAAAPGLKAGEVCTVEITGFFEYDMTGRIVESVTDRAESHQSASSGAQG
ncbi:MAG: MiaB/RimO family radical SAM methylthiotransferase [Spirochaetales bacterium]|nr:MiaB/RimO family radical SAM methylthiotransferase [Spirochaetales bacterium]